MFYFRNLHDSKVTAVHFTQANKAHHTTQDVLPALIVEQHQQQQKKKNKNPNNITRPLITQTMHCYIKAPEIKGFVMGL